MAGVELGSRISIGGMFELNIQFWKESGDEKGKHGKHTGLLGGC